MLYIYISGLTLTQLYNLSRDKINPGLYDDAIILGSKRGKKRISFSCSWTSLEQTDE